MQDTASRWEAAMRRGDFATAFAVNDEVLAGRGGISDDPRLPYHLRFVWDGRPFDGKRVLVRCYHGLGDTLQFVRYLPALRRRAARVTLEVQPELAPLLAHADGADRVVPFDIAAPLTPEECDIEIMELAHVLRLPPSAVALPRIEVPTDAIRSARERLGPGLTIGACWRAGDWDEARSVPLAELIPALGEVRKVRLCRVEEVGGGSNRGLHQLLCSDPSAIRFREAGQSHLASSADSPSPPALAGGEGGVRGGVGCRALTRHAARVDLSRKAGEVILAKCDSPACKGSGFVTSGSSPSPLAGGGREEVSPSVTGSAGSSQNERGSHMTWANPSDALSDIITTAALIASVDLVVTVDTMVAHLAGTLRRPTALLLKASADWRWQNDRTDSPWYPTMRLYRQQREGDWNAPLGRLAADLFRLRTRASAPAPASRSQPAAPSPTR